MCVCARIRLFPWSRQLIWKPERKKQRNYDFSPQMRLFCYAIKQFFFLFAEVRDKKRMGINKKILYLAAGEKRKLYDSEDNNLFF